MEIPNNILEEINLYCKVNNIDDIDKFVLKILRTGFNVEKYGLKPITKEKTEIKDVPLENQILIEETTTIEEPKIVIE